MKNLFKFNKWKIVLFLLMPTFYTQIGIAFCKMCPPAPNYCPPCIQPHFVVPLPIAIWSYVSYGLNTVSIFYLIIGLLVSFLLVYFIFTILQKNKKPLVLEKQPSNL